MSMNSPDFNKAALDNIFYDFSSIKVRNEIDSCLENF